MGRAFRPCVHECAPAAGMHLQISCHSRSKLFLSVMSSSFSAAHSPAHLRWRSPLCRCYLIHHVHLFWVEQVVDLSRARWAGQRCLLLCFDLSAWSDTASLSPSSTHCCILWIDTAPGAAFGVKGTRLTFLPFVHSQLADFHVTSNAAAELF